MYTQCTHCKAIFRVNMREVTVAKGKLRCGECKGVFDASSNLSTTMPESYSKNKERDDIAKKKREKKAGDGISTLSVDLIPDEDFIVTNDPSELAINTPKKKDDSSLFVDGWDLSPDEPVSKSASSAAPAAAKLKSKTESIAETVKKAPAPEIASAPEKKPPTASEPVEHIQQAPPTRKLGNNYNKWLIITAISLAILLLAQVLYNNRHLFTNTPRHEPEKVVMLNHNVFVHPNEKEALLISASMENTAEQPQPYPVLEMVLTDAQSSIVSLRRFLPQEYIENYNSAMLLPVKKPVNFKLKIKDPGKKATRFQFDFL